MSEQNNNNSRAFGTVKVIGKGFVVGEPQLRATKTGKTVMHVRIGFPTSHRKRDGAQASAFFNAEIWNRPNLAEYLQKGKQVWIEGQPVTDSYQNNDGKTVYTTKLVVDNITLLSSPRREDTSAEASSSNEEELDLG